MYNVLITLTRVEICCRSQQVAVGDVSGARPGKLKHGNQCRDATYGCQVHASVLIADGTLSPAAIEDGVLTKEDAGVRGNDKDNKSVAATTANNDL